MRIKKAYPKAIAAVLILASSLTLWSCYPSAPDYIEDYDLVYTQPDNSYDFSKVTTYMLPDSVEHIVNPGDKPDHTYDKTILAELKKQLDALGWTRVTSTAGDVVVLPSVTHQKQGVCQAYCWWCYWGWWPGWGYYPPAWGGGWGWWYPSDVVCATYNTGTLVVNMTNPKQPKPNQLPVVWLGVLNGLLEGGTANINSRIQTNIAQMFKQSPYLNN
ncbi:DUF4136 domain-containing protein [Pinibacter soli]|uniref:DUF4136 domain-containing protein n=1 Tax=Pinibacter soli TaxID=3044211 RepID=A0ABT6RF71_9BACT|nr:DUF4136 domain-containing protein [Pinibacter soli]MDI3320519.1 DUF4136 domain-containing protein [Pinibacter soli]